MLANPWTTVIGVRSSWLVVARNRSLASSSSLAAVTSRKSMTISSRPFSPLHSTSSQRPPGSRWVSLPPPGGGTGKGGGWPVTSSADRPVSAWAAGFHCRMRPAPSRTAIPSALASITARWWARCRTTSSNAIALLSATLACPAISSSSSSSTWPTVLSLYSAYSPP